MIYGLASLEMVVYSCLGVCSTWKYFNLLDGGCLFTVYCLFEDLDFSFDSDSNSHMISSSVTSNLVCCISWYLIFHYIFFSTSLRIFFLGMIDRVWCGGSSILFLLVFSHHVKFFMVIPFHYFQFVALFLKIIVIFLYIHYHLLLCSSIFHSPLVYCLICCFVPHNFLHYLFSLCQQDP